MPSEKSSGGASSKQFREIMRSDHPTIDAEKTYFPPSRSERPIPVKPRAATRAVWFLFSGRRVDQAHLDKLCLSGGRTVKAGCSASHPKPGTAIASNVDGRPQEPQLLGGAIAVPGIPGHNFKSRGSRSRTYSFRPS